MKVKLATTLLGLGLGVSAGMAQAVYMTPADTALYVKFNNQEQISVGNNINDLSGGSEGNWGVFDLTTIALGAPLNDTDWEYAKQPGSIWSADFTDANVGSVSGIWYGVTNTVGGDCAAGAVCGSGGFMDFYWDTAGLAGGGTLANLATAAPGDRTAADQFTNFTDGEFLMRLNFDSGIEATGNYNIVGTAIPVSTGFAGFADSYLSVDVNAGGLWADNWNGDWFDTAFGQRDVRLKNSYNYNSNWGDGSVDDIFGAVSDDPARVYTAPEPTSLALLSLGVLVMGAARRRRRA